MSQVSLQSELTAVEQLSKDIGDAWAKANMHKWVAPGEAIAAHQYLVNSLTPWSDGGQSSMPTSVDFIPVVTIEGMPTNRYPEYLPILTAAAVACMRVVSPHLALALESTEFRKLVSLAVATRAGFWAAMNWTPKCDASLPPRAIVYDKKSRQVWLTATRGDRQHDLWLAMMALKSSTSPISGDGLNGVAVVAPMCGVMASSLQTSLGPQYSFDLVMERVNAVLESRVGVDMARTMGIGTPEVTEVLTMATMTGVPRHAAQVWATDPLVAVGAQRRIAATPSEVELAKAREVRLTSGRATPASASLYESVTPADSTDPMLAVIRAHQEELEAPERTPTVVGAYAEEPGLGSSAVTPTAARSVVSADMRPEIAPAEARFIQEVARHAQQSAPPVPSMLNGADGDESAVW